MTGSEFNSQYYSWPGYWVVMSTDIRTLCVFPDTTIREAIAKADSNRCGIVLVVEEDQKLVGTMTDGDVRRAILADISMDEPVSTLLARKQTTRYAQPITAPLGASQDELFRILRKHNILHLPIVDSNQRVTSLVTLHDFLPSKGLGLQAVIMAGGLGERMRPLTDDLPKPMLPIGDRPLMENIVDQLREAGIHQVNISVNHQSNKITTHFGDGSQFGMDITYVTEEQPLGTAGALGLMDRPKETLLVMNGDILTELDFGAMLEYHREQGAELTLAVQTYDFQVPYGVIDCDGPAVRRLTEKPLLKYLVNAGIYLLEPDVHEIIPNGQRFDMTDLIQRLLDENRPVAAFPIHEYWIDIGRHEDYIQAQKTLKDQRREP